ncbi:K(+)/H(+) antiporter [Rhizophlyctis rosea]|uniref:K(+)/H(+) antiporter n=1 Tax=Rhizophlyctis rosea TaxID=64517 RepID=A0AAD5X5C6_9FUNG|nr:K(+)/H(+) antiporter [Rhizophlyctis rosea]
MAVAAGTFIAGENPLSDQLTLFLLQVVIIVTLSRFLAFLLGFIRQPRVIAEVVGGILLGPSALSRWPAFKDTIFPKESLPKLNLIANFALIFFLYIVGLEIDPTSLRRKLKQSASISLTGIILPFVVGIAISKIIYDAYGDQSVPFYSFFVFIGVAISITAFPVLARILTELKLMTQIVGQTTLAAAAVDDAIAWTLLILVVALINNPSNAVQAIYVFLVTIGWGLLMWFLARPILTKMVQRSRHENGASQTNLLAIFLLICISAWFTQAVGVHAIFGGFLAGLVTPHDRGFSHKLTEKIQEFVGVLLLPLYFAYSGLNTNISTLTDGKAWGLTVLVIAVAIAGKVVGCTAAAKMTGFNWRESFAVGFLMSCKGLVELVVLNLGLQAGVINTKVFTMFVIMALFTTFITTPIVRWIYPESMYKAPINSITDDVVVDTDPTQKNANGEVLPVANGDAASVHSNEKVSVTEEVPVAEKKQSSVDTIV